MTKKLLIILLIVVVAAGAVIGGIFVWRYWQVSKQEEEPEPEVEVPADWKTYRNEEYGFELSLPERWKDYKVSEEIYERITAVSFKLKHTRDEKYHIVFNIGIYPKETWERLQSDEGPSVGTYIGERKGYVFEYSMGHDDEGYVGFPEVVPGETYHGPFYDVQNKIMPSFRFIEPSESDTSDWRTYRNEKYGFEVKYPNDWRVANSIMEWGSEAAADPSYTPNIDDWVMITNLTQEEEKEYLEALENYIGIGIALNYIKNADGRSISIAPTFIPLETLRTMKTPGYETSNFRELKIDSGLTVTRFREKVTWEMNRDSEVAAVPYFGNKTLRGNKITFITISIERNEGNFEEEVFNQMLSTFKFIE